MYKYLIFIKLIFHGNFIRLTRDTKYFATSEAYNGEKDVL